MELCSGMPLFHHVKKLPDQRLPEETARIVFRQLMLGVGYMHSRGRAHRDLKLDNLLFDAETNKVKIIDFGFSLATTSSQPCSSYCGTPHYMSPEIVKKTPFNAFASDIWACGVILYLLVAGRLPFFGEFEADLYRKIQSGKFAPLPADVQNGSLKVLLSSIFQTNEALRPCADDILRSPWLQQNFDPASEP